MLGLADSIFKCFKELEKFSLKDVYNRYTDKPKETVRARIYENIGIKFQRIAKGVYQTIEGMESCVAIEGDGRNLS